MEGVKSYILSVHDIVCALAFSPYEWCGSLLAVGTQSRVTILNCRFPEEDPNLEDIHCEQIRDFHHGCRAQAISWSPQTSLAQLPKSLKFVTAGSDMKLRCFSSDLKHDDRVSLIEGHTDHINDVAFEPHSGEEIASVSDDHTCCIWATDSNLKVRFSLTSPGMSVSWHRNEPTKLMVAEKKGLIRLYSVTNQQPIMSLDCSCSPLMCARWCPSNSLRIGGVAGTEWFLWNTSLSSRPAEHRTAHNEGVISFNFSNISENIFATRNCRGNQIKVINPKITQALFITELATGSGLSWHFRLQLLAVGGDCKVHLWKIDST